mmetsp:Transcript_560/g.666  ORF Transcript_560/g.666 Transcript_560/m.666 type:complete len:105 (-) Transcript_560:389-703(-)
MPVYNHDKHAILMTNISTCLLRLVVKHGFNSVSFLCIQMNPFRVKCDRAVGEFLFSWFRCYEPKGVQKNAHENLSLLASHIFPKTNSITSPEEWKLELVNTFAF